MKEALYFVYNGVNSQDLGVTQVQVNNTDMYHEQFMGDITIQEVQIRHRHIPYFQGIVRAPLQFDLTMAFDQNIVPNCVELIAQTFYVDDYKPFYLANDPNRIWYCMPTGSSTITHDGCGRGYISLTMRCDSPYAYRPTFVSEVFSTSTFSVNNTGDIPVAPEIWIKKIGDGDVSITNLTTNQIFAFSDLLDGEMVYVDNEAEYIESSLQPSNIYRYNNFNDNYMVLAVGKNDFSVEGDCTVQFRINARLLAGLV
jgi:phage-related protein